MTKLDEALGLFPSVIKSGEHWSATCQNVLDAAKVELTALRAASAPAAVREAAWRAMDTAPKSGEVLLQVKMRAGIPGKCLVGHYIPGGHCISDHPPIDDGWYFWNGCYFDKASEPIAWMPIPEVTALATPEEASTAAGEPQS